jgi:hypothetical protein
LTETDIRERNKDEMVAKLETADKNSRFPQFLKLAPELRNMVYLYAMDDKRRVRPAPPPISRTCRLIRAESLPVFFKNVRMTVHATRGWPDLPAPKDAVVICDCHGWTIYITKAYSDYFNYATKQGWTKHMRRFRWYVSSDVRNVHVRIRSQSVRVDKYEVEYSKTPKGGQVTGSTVMPQARPAPDTKGVAKPTPPEKVRVIDCKTDSVFEWFFEAHRELMKDALTV